MGPGFKLHTQGRPCVFCFSWMALVSKGLMWCSQRKMSYGTNTEYGTCIPTGLSQVEIRHLLELQPVSLDMLASPEMKCCSMTLRMAWQPPAGLIQPRFA